MTLAGRQVETETYRHERLGDRHFNAFTLLINNLR